MRLHEHGKWLVLMVFMGMPIHAYSQPMDDPEVFTGLPDISDTAFAQDAGHVSMFGKGARAYAEIAFDGVHPSSSTSGKDGVSRALWNLSLDAYSQIRVGEDLKLVFSDRLNIGGGERQAFNSDSVTNALRELYLGYGKDSSSLEVGRINLRSGVGLGYNPSDYFRSNSIIFWPTQDPVKLRETRLGVFALNAKMASAAGSASIAVVPKVTGGDSDSPFALRHKQTNDASRIAATASPNLEGWPYLGFSAFKREDDPIRLGANVSTAIGSSIVAHLEWSGARQHSLIDRAQTAFLQNPTETPTANGLHFRNQYALGLTYTAPNRLNIAIEYEYNGAGVGRSKWLQLNRTDPSARLYGNLLQYAQTQQEIVTRQAWMLRLNWPQFPLRETELTGLLRFNPYDHSHFAWLEVRYHLRATSFGLALTRNFGTPRSEFGSLPSATVVSVAAQFYF